MQRCVRRVGHAASPSVGPRRSTNRKPVWRNGCTPAVSPRAKSLPRLVSAVRPSTVCSQIGPTTPPNRAHGCLCSTATSRASRRGRVLDWLPVSVYEFAVPSFAALVNRESGDNKSRNGIKPGDAGDVLVVPEALREGAQMPYSAASSWADSSTMTEPRQARRPDPTSSPRSTTARTRCTSCWCGWES